MLIKLSACLLLLISVRASEGGQHAEQHRNEGARRPAKTRATEYLECDVEERLTYVHPGEQVTVVSPNWPNNYGRWEHCGWRFWTMFDATLIFFCDEVKLSEGDPLEVYQDLTDGAYKNKYTMDNGTLHFDHGYVNVEFSSSLFNGNAGFKCHVQSKAKETTPPPTTTVQSGQELPAGGGAENPAPAPEPENPVPETQPENPPRGSALQCSGVQSGIFVEPGNSVTLVSPGYPSMYPVKTECGWDITTTLGVGLQVSCGFFDLNNHDYLLLAHGPRANKHKFVFDQAPQRRKFSKSRLMVRFSSSTYTPGAGFSCTVTTFQP